MHSPNRILSSLTLLLGAIAVLLTAACKQEQSTAPAARPPEVAVVVLEEQPVTLTTELPGRTAAYLVAEIRPQVNGIILDRVFTEGADVGKGSLLYRIDPQPYQAALDQAAAALEVAEAQLPALRSRAERMQQLATVKAVGEQDAEDAAAALRQAEANVSAAKAALHSARINLSYTPIAAPISGRIGRSAVTIGALVSAYQPVPLAVIQQLDPIYVDVTQASSELLRLQRAMGSGRLSDGDSSTTVTLLLEDGTSYAHEGTLAFRDVSVDPSTGSVVLRMVFPNPDHVLLPGMYVRAVVEEGVMERAVLAPQQGITRDTKGNPIAWIVDDAGTVMQRELTLDRAIGDTWLVSTGLQRGDRLIVEGRQKVRPGTTATAVPFASPGTEAPPDAPAPQAR